MPQQLFRTRALESKVGLYTQHWGRNPLWEDIFISFHLCPVHVQKYKVMAAHFFISQCYASVLETNYSLMFGDWNRNGSPSTLTLNPAGAL